MESEKKPQIGSGTMSRGMFFKMAAAYRMRVYVKTKIFFFLLILLLCVVVVPMANAMNGDSSVLQYDTLVPQQEISSGGGLVFMSKNVYITSTTKVMVTASLRWFPQNNATTIGDRVAYIRIDNQDVGVLMITDSSPNNFQQFSVSAAYSTMLNAGYHNFAVHAGGCCGIYGHDFIVGAGSRIDIVW
jgi:hypothetical protein